MRWWFWLDTIPKLPNPNLSNSHSIWLENQELQLLPLLMLTVIMRAYCRSICDWYWISYLPSTTETKHSSVNSNAMWAFVTRASKISRSFFTAVSFVVHQIYLFSCLWCFFFVFRWFVVDNLDMNNKLNECWTWMRWKTMPAMTNKYFHPPETITKHKSMRLFCRFDPENLAKSTNSFPPRRVAALWRIEDGCFSIPSMVVQRTIESGELIGLSDDVTSTYR